jgi:hypothetical protein
MQKVDKHPTFAQKPIPSFQLLSKLSKFQGERKDIITKNPQDILSSTRNSQYGVMQSNDNSQANELLQQYQQRSDERNQVNIIFYFCFVTAYIFLSFQQSQIEKEYAAFLDPNYKPVDKSATAAKVQHRNQYSNQMDSNVGKLFKANDKTSSDAEELTMQSKRMTSARVSNFDNSLIGGQKSEGDPWVTTAQQMGNTDSDTLNRKNKKPASKFEPELFVSPITGEPMADYGDWKDTLKNQGNLSNLKQKREEETDSAVIDDPILMKLKTQLSLRGAKGIIGLGRLFRIADDDGSNSLSFQEFKKAMKDFGMSLSDTETILLFKKFGKNSYSLA